MDTRKVVELLDGIVTRQGGRFAVIGGWGLMAHGIQRTTFDLDVVVGKDSQQALIEALEARGYRTLHRSDGFSNHLHPEAALGRLDLVYVDGPTAEQLFRGCRRTELLPQLAVDVPRPEHLVAMKVRAIKNDPSRRLQDLADIRSLALLPGVDRQEIAGYFDRLELSDLFDQLQLDD